jgi:hypothetical protein
MCYSDRTAKLSYLVSVHPLGLDLVVFPLQLGQTLGLLLGATHKDLSPVDLFFIESIHGSLGLKNEPKLSIVIRSGKSDPNIGVTCSANS